MSKSKIALADVVKYEASRARDAVRKHFEQIARYYAENPTTDLYSALERSALIHQHVSKNLRQAEQAGLAHDRPADHQIVQAAGESMDELHERLSILSR